MVSDEYYMQLALNIAEAGRGQTSPNPLVGCVLVKDGRIVGQGAHLRAGGPHAEVHALAMAGQDANGSTAYVTLEPCSHFGRTPPCADALISAGIRRVVMAAVDKDPRVDGGGITKLRAAGIEVVVGVLADAAEKQNEVFRTWVKRKRPFVLWKCATTLDGCVAATNGHSQYVTGEEARRMVQTLRRQYAGIAVGVGTVMADNPRLTVHHHAGQQPLRVIFDSRLQTPPAARLFTEPGQTILLHTEAAPMLARQRLMEAGGECVEVVADAAGRVSVTDALAALASRNVDSLLLEGGPRLASAFLAAQCIDKVVYFVAPKLLGGGLRALTGPTTEHMDQAVSLCDVEVQQYGVDLCITGYPRYRGGDAECLPD